MRSFLPIEITSRVRIPSPLTGKLVRIHRNETYEDILGIYVGSFRTPKWDPAGEYTFHSILGGDGVVHSYCFRNSEVVSRIIEVLS